VGVVSQNTGPNSASFLTVQVSDAGSTGFSITDGNYPGWCIDNPDSNVLEVSMAFPMISSYDSAASSLFPATPWPKINYVLNHKQSATFQDVQQAIWMLIFGNSAGHFPVTAAVTTMLNGANANPNYVPPAGGVLAVLVRVDGPSGPGGIQDYIMEVPIPGRGTQTTPPVISCGTVSTTTGVQGAPFNAQLSVTGGTSPFTFQIVSGTLPMNLTLNRATGQISGTPIVAGAFPIAFKVTDSDPRLLSWTTTSSCTINITPTNTGGNFTTYTQGGWGAAPHGNNPGSILKAFFTSAFPGGSVSIGSGAKVLTFTSASAIQNFLPAGCTPGTVSASATNPASSAAGVFAGQLLAATLSYNFSKAGITKFGLATLKVKSGVLSGYTVGQVLALANQVIAGNFTSMPAGLTVAGLSDVLNSINNNFDNGTQNQGYLQ
jgi:hypothetical protein